jgi:uncharacterized membrane protein
MQTRTRVMGHPIHPMLVVFPLGLFITAVVFDLVYLVSGNDTFSQVGFWNITAGAIGAILAAAAGLLDWTGIPSSTRAKRLGLWHGGLNALVLVLFLLCWIVRLNEAGHTLGGGLFVVEIIAIAIGGTAAWMGGELVDRLGIGVDEDANPNASSSLASASRR